jgi:hypothetical protein
MAQHPDFLSANLDDMIEIAAMAWRSSPQEGVHLLHKFQDVRDTFLIFAQAYQHAASLAAEPPAELCIRDGSIPR